MMTNLLKHSKCLITCRQAAFSSSINQPPAVIQNIRKQLSDNGWRFPDTTHKKSEKTHLSQAEYFIHQIPVIHTHESVVRCMGGTQTGAGHPTVYIQLDTRKAGEPVPCKYCGLRYALDSHHH